MLGRWSVAQGASDQRVRVAGLAAPKQTCGAPRIGLARRLVAEERGELVL
jgi:hypothetical protein